MEEVQAVGTHGRNTAAGMDGWEPAEIALLSPALFAKLALLFNLIEDGAEWPACTNHARAAYLSKDPDNADDPLAYRVLLILPAFYRLYGTVRLRSMQEWADSWSMAEMSAGAGLQSADDAWYEVASDFELWDLSGCSYLGGAIDIAKCVDQILRELVYAVASLAGIPPQVLDAYRRYQENLIVHNSIAGGIGKGFRRRCGIPQGCPLSMLFTALLMRPWLLMAKSRGCLPRILADDILLIATGRGAIRRFATVLHLSRQYLLDMGAKIPH